MADGLDLVRIIGDELFFEGQLVAILTTGTGASVMARFCDVIQDGADEAETCQCPPRQHKQDCDFYRAEDDTALPYDQALDDLVDHAGPLMRNGLLRRADLVRIIAQLKKEPQ